MNYGIYMEPEKVVYPERLEYTVDFINNHPILPINVNFHLTQNKESAAIIYAERSSGADKCIYMARHLFNEKLPDTFYCHHHILFNKEYHSIDKRKEHDLLTDFAVPFDLFESIFFCISRIEEKHLDFEKYLGEKEAYDESFLTIRNNIHHIPVADHLIGLLVELITGHKPLVPTSFALSHDIDEIRKYRYWYSPFRKMAGQLLHRKNISRLPLIWSQAINAKNNDPFDTSGWMLSDRKDIRKEMYFLCGGVHKWDTPYSLQDPVSNNFIDIGKSRNYHIGIHPSYESWNNLELIKEEKEKLENAINQPITISRQHFLNFDVSITPYLLSKIGIKKDSSIGFSRHIGFRSGTGFDHKLYDFDLEKPMDLVESPLVFMDVAALYEVDYDVPAYKELLQKFIAQNAFNTHINFLYHNTIFDEIVMRGHSIKADYLKLFKHGQG